MGGLAERGLRFVGWILYSTFPAVLYKLVHTEWSRRIKCEIK